MKNLVLLSLLYTMVSCTNDVSEFVTASSVSTGQPVVLNQQYGGFGIASPQPGAVYKRWENVPVKFECSGKLGEPIDFQIIYTRTDQEGVIAVFSKFVGQVDECKENGYSSSEWRPSHPGSYALIVNKRSDPKKSISRIDFTVEESGYIFPNIQCRGEGVDSICLEEISPVSSGSYKIGQEFLIRLNLHHVLLSEERPVFAWDVLISADGTIGDRGSSIEYSREHGDEEGLTYSFTPRREGVHTMVYKVYGTSMSGGDISVKRLYFLGLVNFKVNRVDNGGQKGGQPTPPVTTDPVEITLEVRDDRNMTSDIYQSSVFFKVVNHKGNSKDWALKVYKIENEDSELGQEIFTDSDIRCLHENWISGRCDKESNFVQYQDEHTIQGQFKVKHIGWYKLEVASNGQIFSRKFQKLHVPRIPEGEDY